MGHCCGYVVSRPEGFGKNRPGYRQTRLGVRVHSYGVTMGAGPGICSILDRMATAEWTPGLDWVCEVAIGSPVPGVWMEQSTTCCPHAHALLIDRSAGARERNQSPLPPRQALPFLQCAPVPSADKAFYRAPCKRKMLKVQSIIPEQVLKGDCGAKRQKNR